jgi:hypothetical protein
MILEFSICGFVLELSNKEIVAVRNHFVAKDVLFQISLVVVLMENTCCGTLCVSWC